MDLQSLVRIVGTATLDGIELADAESAMAAIHEDLTAPEDLLDWNYRENDLLLNLGRPTAIIPLYAQQIRMLPDEGVLGPIWDALYSDGDTATALASIRIASAVARGPIKSDPKQRGAQYDVMCAVAAWSLARQDTTGIGLLLGRLERPLLPTGAIQRAKQVAACADAIQSMLAVNRGDTAEARSRIERVETWLDEQSYEPVVQMVVAQVRERLGEPALALRAVRHRSYHWNETWLLSSLVREEGRLAALTGDRDGAVRAYQQYLRLRAGAEPRLQPQVAQVREELGRLLQE
jgi:hypothetical protein